MFSSHIAGEVTKERNTDLKNRVEMVRVRRLFLSGYEGE